MRTTEKLKCGCWSGVILLLRAAAGSAASGPPNAEALAQWERDGRSLFLALQQWDCRAGQNSLIIRTDGTLAPCFPTYRATRDWGAAGQPHFERQQLARMKVEYQEHRFSTLNHNLSYCYDASRAIRWVLRQAANGFRGTTGSFED